jgi:hypothetical protein
MSRRIDYGQIRRVFFEGNSWVEGEIDEELAGWISARDHMIVLRYGNPPYKVTLGVPHQASAGAEQICDLRVDDEGNPWPRDADENTAPIGLVAFETLKSLGIPCKLIIMAHATTHDPNKLPGSPYCQEVFAEPTEMLFECHGSSARRRLALELSAGKNHLIDPVSVGRMLASELGYRYTLGVQRENGKSHALILGANGKEIEGLLELPASKTISLIEAGKKNIPALHLEAKPVFRKAPGRRNGLSQEGAFLGRAVARTLRRY